MMYDYQELASVMKAFYKDEKDIQYFDTVFNKWFDLKTEPTWWPTFKYRVKPDNTIPISQLKDGEICVIRKWEDTRHIGKICQRHKDTLIVLGSDYTGCFLGGALFTGKYDKGCRVQVLPKDEVLSIVKELADLEDN